MNPHYVITRTRDTVTSICRSCGDTSGPRRDDRYVEAWQRRHADVHALGTAGRTPRRSKNRPKTRRDRGRG